MKPLARTLAGFALTIVFAYVLGSVVQTILNGGDVISAVVQETWRVLFTGGLVALGLFLLFSLVVNYAARARGNGVLFWVNAGALVAAIVLGVLMSFAAGILVGALTGGLAWMSAFTSVLAAGEIFAGGLIALAVVHFGVMKTDPAPAVEPVR